MDPMPPQPLDYRTPQPRFRLLRRIALALLVVVAIAGTWWGTKRLREVRRQQAISIIEQNGGTLVRDKEGTVERVYLASPPAGDVALERIAPHLRHMRGLKQLDLVGKGFSDEGLRKLTDLDHVRDLYIFNTSASAQGIADLQKRFPHLNVKQLPPNLPASKLAALNVYPHAVTALALLDAGDLLTGSGDGYLRRWPQDAAHPTREIHAHKDWLFSISLSPDRKTIATGGGDNLVRLWDAATLAPIADLSGHTDDVHAVLFHPDGNTLFSAGDDRTIHVWDVKHRTRRHVIAAHDAQIPSLSLSPDGRLLASASRDGTARLWDTRTRRLLHVLRHDDDVSAVRFSPDGRTLATSSYDKMIKLWNPRDGSLTRTFPGHTDWIFSLAFSPDGGSLYSAARDKTLRVWNVRSGTPFDAVTDDRVISAIGFDVTGSTVITAAADGSVLFRDRDTLAARRTLLPAFEVFACSR
jgi:WD40 repeat protein